MTGAATVILAMGEGRHAAADIDRFLKGEGAAVEEWPGVDLSNPVHQTAPAGRAEPEP